ncbi:Uncharacterized protein GBIM_07256 [Gryllus bimaculatus]|nr:Uncharacterized protein GBIM_07256 [Gryllus bimaculatus]
MEYFQRFKEFRRRVHLFRALHPRSRVLRDRSNPLENFTESEFRRRYRFSKETTIYLADMLRPNLDHQDRRGLGLPVMLQLLVVLSDNFPGIIGAIDCTHVRIMCPRKEEAERFCNRKRYYSINCQVICDADKKITNIVARWPGSCHDSRIFRNSVIKEVLESGTFSGHLIGDNGYACFRYLLTPVVNERTPAERRYNEAHKSARNVIESVFGSWKKRFPCLHYTLRTKVSTTLKIIVASAILHNIAVERAEEEFDDALEEEEVEVEADEADHPEGLRTYSRLKSGLS